LKILERTTLDVKRDEGFRDYPYLCTAGKLTIGWGRNLEGKPLSRKIAEMMLYEDISEAYGECFDVFPRFYEFNEQRQRAFTNMMLNLGLPRFRTFKNMIEAAKESDWERAADEAKDSKWYEQVGQRAHRIVNLIREEG